MSKATVKIEKKYLVFPVGNHDFIPNRKVKLFCGGELVFDFDAPVDYYDPRFNVFVDVSEYIGRELDVEINISKEFENVQSDEKYYREAQIAHFRPKLHFTADFGWLNDPNGLVKYTSKRTGKTLWHMFFQHNPYDTRWGNMSWGHCVSEDLIHWTQREIALHPDKFGTMYSGSAIVDHDNLSGLKDGEEDPILLFYTAAGSNNELSASQPFTQCLAYSTDGGESFVKYANNPIVPHIAGANRDPKVVFCDELGCFIMALYLEGNDYALLRSSDLIKWTQFQRITMADDSECPDFFPAEVSGEQNERVWVLRGAGHHYMIFCFNEVSGKFDVIQDSEKHFYSNSYASQTFFCDENRRISMSWENGLRFPDSAFMSQISYPSVLSVKKEDGKYLLCSNPVAEFDALGGRSSTYGAISLSPGESSIFDLPDDVHDIRAEIPDNDAKLELSLFGNSFMLDFAGGNIICGNNTLPILYKNCGRIRFIIDTCSCTFVVGDGRLGATVSFVCDYNINTLVIRSDKDAFIDRLDIRRIDI